ncbi:MAG: hypothetical protein HC876_22270 [Chloroflexaceae bacterium]|nr:hypothetical protein [Chloroflexaceae bacterium]
MAVETQGLDGAKHVLTEDAIAHADVVILAADIAIDRSRFGNKPIYETSTSEAIRNTHTVLSSALGLLGTSATPPRNLSPLLHLPRPALAASCW